jgi:Xaa-Pro dipeptidase
VIDYGANYEGYLSDITRTFAIGGVSEELRRIYETVKQANAAGRAKVAPGVPAGEVDAAARIVIDAAGYGEYFFHRTGHGLGMEGHEPPYIRGDNQLVLRPGMTFTVEPGIYITGLGGVRIEDDVAVAVDGCDTLTTLPRELETLG